MTQPPYPNPAQQPGQNDQNLPPQQWAPSAYSAPGAGPYPYGYQQPPVPAKPNGFAGLFSLNFSKPVASLIAKPLMVIAYVLAATEVVLGFVLFLAMVTQDASYGSGMSLGTMMGSGLSVFLGIVVLVLAIAGALFLVGATRAILDYIVHSQEEKAE